MVFGLENANLANFRRGAKKVTKFTEGIHLTPISYVPVLKNLSPEVGLPNAALAIGEVFGTTTEVVRPIVEHGDLTEAKTTSALGAAGTSAVFGSALYVLARNVHAAIAELPRPAKRVAAPVAGFVGGAVAPVVAARYGSGAIAAGKEALAAVGVTELVANAPEGLRVVKSKAIATWRKAQGQIQPAVSRVQSAVRPRPFAQPSRSPSPSRPVPAPSGKRSRRSSRTRKARSKARRRAKPKRRSR